MKVFDDGTGAAVYMASNADLVAPSWRWQRGRWQNISQGAGQYALALGVTSAFGAPELYMSGFSNPGPSAVYWGKRWNGSEWVDPPPGFVTSDIMPVMTCDVGSGLKTYGRRRITSEAYAGLMEWTGTQWIELGSFLGSTPVLPMVVYDDGNGPGIVVAGEFTSVSGIPALKFAMWRNGAWVTFPPPANVGSIWDLAVYDDGSGPGFYAVYVGGGAATEGIIRWDGHAWGSVGGGIGTGFVGVHSLAVFDDGSGSALYAAGGFTTAGGLPVRNIARWNGTAWSMPGLGAGAYIDKMVVLDDGRSRSLFIGGTFAGAGAGQSPTIARWVGCPGCYSNCDYSDGVSKLNVNDFMCFLNRFAANDPYANCNLDTAINVADFMCFLTKFASGCS